MHMERFVVLYDEGEWIVTLQDTQLSSFKTRDEAERVAFRAAEIAAETGLAVSVLLLPSEARRPEPSSRATS